VIIAWEHDTIAWGTELELGRMTVDEQIARQRLGQHYQEKPGSIVSFCIPGTRTADPLDGKQAFDPLDL
jgi:hypothetical protein